MALIGQNQPLTMGYEYSATHVYVRFSQPVTRLMITRDETAAMIRALQEALNMQEKAILTAAQKPAEQKAD